VFFGSESFPCIVFAAFLALIIVLVVLGQIQEGKRREALAAWAQSRGLAYHAGSRSDFEDRFPWFGALQEGDNRYAYNWMEGASGPRPLWAFDYHYETHSTDSKGQRQTSHHQFSGLIVRCEFPLRPLLIRPEGLFDKLGAAFGFNDIDFESAEFSRRFYVKSPDRRWAYDVIQPRTMERLLAGPRLTYEFAADHLMVYDGRRWSPAEFDRALVLAGELLDGVPEFARTGGAAEN